MKRQAENCVVQLDGDTVEVELEILGILRTIRGKGIYDDSDPDLGQVFKIYVSDPSGDFEILFPGSTCVFKPEGDH